MSFIDVISWLPLVYLAVITVPLVVIDIQQHRLPNKLVLPLIALSLIVSVVVNVANGSWLNLLAGLGIPVLVFALGIYLNYHEWIGMGDVKFLFGVLVALSIFSPYVALLVIPIALGFGFISAVYNIATKRAGQSVPLGPWIIVATATTTAIMFAW
jgi:leader peptidase (prepilin peptidase)/N-methyltransferase